MAEKRSDLLEESAAWPGVQRVSPPSTMEADSSLAGKTYSDINGYMRRFGFDYTEHPNSPAVTADKSTVSTWTARTCC